MFGPYYKTQNLLQEANLCLFFLISTEHVRADFIIGQNVM